MARTWGVEGAPVEVRRATLWALALGAKMIPRAPQDPPRPLQEASWYRCSTILGSNLMVLMANLRDFRPPTLWILQLTNQPKKQSTNQPSQQTSPRKHTSRYPYIPRPGGGWAEGNWIRRPRRGAGRVQDNQPNPTNHQILLLTITDRPLWSINS